MHASAVAPHILRVYDLLVYTLVMHFVVAGLGGNVAQDLLALDQLKVLAVDGDLRLDLVRLDERVDTIVLSSRTSRRSS